MPIRQPKPSTKWAILSFGSGLWSAPLCSAKYAGYPINWNRQPHDFLLMWFTSSHTQAIQEWARGNMADKIEKDKGQRRLRGNHQCPAG